MAVLISVLKVDLSQHKHLGQELSTRSSKVKELDQACVYKPLPGKLREMVVILKAATVVYTTQADTTETVKKQATPEKTKANVQELVAKTQAMVQLSKQAVAEAKELISSLREISEEIKDQMRKEPDA
jgi:hypothetical protein